MRLVVQVLNTNVRKWNSNLENKLGLKLEPHLFLGAATLLILLTQAALFYLLSSREVYCRLPNLRGQRLACSLSSYEKLPWIYVITPTYSRHVQKAELTRLSQTLLLVPNVHWIIVEDSDWQSDVVSKLVRRLKNEFDFHSVTLLHEKTPPEYKLKHGEPRWKQPKGVWQRNKAIRWLRNNLVHLDRDAIVYFADDDNTYDIGIFDEMRSTKGVAVWPVGFAGGLLVEKPLIHENHHQRVSGFNSMWEKRRPFPLDMAGFAVSLRLLMSRPEVSFSHQQPIGYMESHFLGQLIKSWDDLEPKADECTKVLVWHTQTRNPDLHEERKLSLPSHTGMDL